LTGASAHDSQVIDNLFYEDDKGEGFYADSAHTGQKQDKTLSDKMETENR